MMKQNKEGSTKIALLRQAWKNPKQKALIKISCYFIFFMILVVFVRVNNHSYPEVTKTTPKEKTTVEKLESMRNYEYQIEINENQMIQKVTGIQYQDIHEFDFLNIKYIIQNNQIYRKETQELVSNLFSFDICNIFPDNIKNYILDSDLKSETKYQNKKIKKEYQIKSFPFINQETNQSILLTIYEDSNYITKMEINATETMKANNPNIKNEIITIYFENVNAITNYQSS